ncbi:MAG: permease [Verrucomicrobiota bacterium]|nr:permease [Verrucomicrobiota bacterium]
MSTKTLALPTNESAFPSIRCYWRPVILIAAAALILCTFWFWSRYPALVSKAAHIGKAVPTMTYTSELIAVKADAPIWWQITATSVNWLNGMKVGMTFGVLFGSLLHTILRYYPLKVGKNLYINSLKGALIGVPMGVCENCAVPTACGVTRGNGRVEVALGFLFSSPTFNPVVVAMTFTAFPLLMCITKYLLVAGVIVFVVPGLISLLERNKTLPALNLGGACEIPQPQAPKTGSCAEGFFAVFAELLKDFGRNVWMLLKPTVTLMVLASVLAAALIVLVPWSSLLSEVTPLKAAVVSLLAVIMPVPIALDVMFPVQLLHQGIAPGYVMMLTSTLGTFSIIPAIYLWRDVSKTLAISLLGFFFIVGWILAMTF